MDIAVGLDGKRDVVDLEMSEDKVPIAVSDSLIYVMARCTKNGNKSSLLLIIQIIICYSAKMERPI